MIIWNICLTILCLMLMFCIGRLAREIEAIKSWYPFCEMLKIKVDDLEAEE